jgi:DNA topoisomerase I
MLTNAELELRLETAHLRYVTTNEPGYTRRRKGRGFAYYNQREELIQDPKIIERIHALVIPPAWQQVWISRSANAHIQAFGRDEKGRKQYIYHTRWQEISNESKFSSLVDFAAALPKLRKIVHADLGKRELTQRKLLALVVALLEQTLIRVGNDEYVRSNDTYGLTTLMDEHVHVKGTNIKFEFVGKSGKAHAITLRDRRLASLVKTCQDIPGHDLFQYYDDTGAPHPIGSGDVNAYLLEATGHPFTAKVFRTWGGSVLMVDALCNMPPAETQKEREKQVRQGIRQVADTLQNTIAVCRKYYVHPAIIEAHHQDTLQQHYHTKSASNNPYALTPAERALVSLLKSVQNA